MSQIAFSFDGMEDTLTNPYIYDLPEIKAKSTVVIDAQIKIPVAVGYLLKAQFMTHIYLTDFRNTDVEPIPCLHLFPYDIRTGFHYQPAPEQDIVFVINEKTHLNEVNFITSMCQYYGLKHNFYDITMHGKLDLFTPLPHLQTFLAQDLKGKTLALLNNEFTVSSTSQNLVNAWSHEFLIKSQVVRAAGEFDVHFVIFSPHPHNFVAWSL